MSLEGRRHEIVSGGALKQCRIPRSLMPQMQMTQFVTFLLFTAFAAMITGGLVLVAMSARSRDRMRELMMRERIAMIEKGLVPSPESDPARFDLLMGTRGQPNAKSLRYRSAGVLVMGLGVAMIILLSYAARVPETGVGVGGGIFVLGLAAYLTGKLSDE